LSELEVSRRLLQHVDPLLFISSNPSGISPPLDLDEEYRVIEEENARRNHVFAPWRMLAARVEDIRNGIQDHHPVIVHFAGHGQCGERSREGCGVSSTSMLARDVSSMPLRDVSVPVRVDHGCAGDGGLVVRAADGSAQLVTESAIGELFRLPRGTVRLVVLNACVLNACHSDSFADAILPYVDAVVDCPVRLGARQRGVHAAFLLLACSDARSMERMKRLALLIAICCAPAIACTTGGGEDIPVDPGGGEDIPVDPGGGEDIPVDPAFAPALAARKTPELVLPARPVTSIGRCAIAIGPRPPVTSDLVRAEFTARNGAGWSIGASSFDPTNMALSNVSTATVGSQAPIALTDDEALKLAITFVAENYELFGLSRTDLADVQTYLARRLDGTLLVQFYAQNPLRGYEQFPTLVQGWYWGVAIDPSSAIQWVIAATGDLLPTFQLCTTPLIASGDPRLTKDVIGYHLSYSDSAGQFVDAGVVDASDITDLALSIHRTWLDEQHTVTLRLAYAISVTRQHLFWTFFVDADTGDLIEVQQQFAT
jgi:hypothetical protein